MKSLLGFILRGIDYFGCGLFVLEGEFGVKKPEDVTENICEKIS